MKPSLRIVIENNRISVEKGTETIALDICDSDIVHIWATQRDGAQMIATLKFADDEVVLLEKP